MYYVILVFGRRRNSVLKVLSRVLDRDYIYNSNLFLKVFIVMWISFLKG